jgi:hypothetical protein
MIGSRITKKCTKALITTLTSQINGGNAITPGLSDDASDSAIVRRRRLPGDERFSTSLKRIWKPGKNNR